MLTTILIGVAAGLAYNLTRPIEAIIGPGSMQRSAPKPSPARGDGVRYVVKGGDTLSSIALARTGKAANWSEIYATNALQIHFAQSERGVKRGPDAIFEGTELLIPQRLMA